MTKRTKAFGMTRVSGCCGGAVVKRPPPGAGWACSDCDRPVAICRPKAKPTRKELEYRLALISVCLVGVESRPPSPSKAAEMRIVEILREILDGKSDLPR